MPRIPWLALLWFAGAGVLAVYAGYHYWWAFQGSPLFERDLPQVCGKVLTAQPEIALTGPYLDLRLQGVSDSFQLRTTASDGPVLAEQVRGHDVCLRYQPGAGRRPFGAAVWELRVDGPIVIGLPWLQQFTRQDARSAKAISALSAGLAALAAWWGVRALKGAW
jgi:hypothetical protein